MPTSKNRTPVQLPAALHAEAKAAAQQRYMAVNVLVALAVREWLDRQPTYPAPTSRGDSTMDEQRRHGLIANALCLYEDAQSFDGCLEAVATLLFLNDTSQDWTAIRADLVARRASYGTLPPNRSGFPAAR